MPGGYFYPPPVAGKRRKKTVAGTRVNYGSGGSPEPEPLNSGEELDNFTEIIFIHTKYIKN